jgi:hypothetical protein
MVRYWHSHPESNTTVFIAPALQRFGLTDDLALRRAAGGLRLANVNGGLAAHGAAEETGVQDPSVGVKVSVVEGDGVRPSVAVLVQGDVDPEARGAFKDEGVRPSLRTALDWRLPHDFSLAAVPGIVYDKTDGRRHAAGTLGIALGKAWTQRFQTYVEAAAERIASSRRGGSTVTYNLGGAYLLGDAVQIDSALSWGAGSDTAPLVWTVGLWMLF